MTMSLVEWLAADPERCSHGYHRTAQTCPDCAPTTEWGIFTAALHRAAGSDGRIHQSDVRPLIQSIPPKHRGLLYRRARTEGLIREVGWEQSTDVAGGNADKQSRVYELRAS